MGRIANKISENEFTKLLENNKPSTNEGKVTVSFILFFWFQKKYFSLKFKRRTLDDEDW